MGRRFVVTAISVGAAFMAAFAPPARAVPAAVFDAIPVFYEGEPCEDEWIEIEVFDRKTEAWSAHPEHPRIPVGSCQDEDPGRLLNELRWRCATSEGVAPWRHFPVFRPGVFTHCVHEQILEGERQRIRDAQRKRLDLRPEIEEDPREPDATNAP